MGGKRQSIAGVQCRCNIWYWSVLLVEKEREWHKRQAECGRRRPRIEKRKKQPGQAGEPGEPENAAGRARNRKTVSLWSVFLFSAAAHLSCSCCFGAGDTFCLSPFLFCFCCARRVGNTGTREGKQARLGCNACVFARASAAKPLLFLAAFARAVSA